jgi:hypothetical protein
MTGSPLANVKLPIPEGSGSTHECVWSDHVTRSTVEAKLTYGSILQQNHTCRRHDGSGGDSLFLSQAVHSPCVTLHGLLTLRVLV